MVAPCVGAWIETIAFLCKNRPAASHPAWVRGLKHQPFCSGHIIRRSHPAWVRGLKLKNKPMINRYRSSHPAWVRGLKRTGSCVAL